MSPLARWIASYPGIKGAWCRKLCFWTLSRKGLIKKFLIFLQYGKGNRAQVSQGILFSLESQGKSWILDEKSENLDKKSGKLFKKRRLYQNLDRFQKYLILRG